MTDKKIIWAELRATQPLQYRWGTFAPYLTVVCFTESQTDWSDGLALRLISRVSPNIESISYGKATRMTLRFDTTEARDVEFSIDDFGDGHSMEPTDLLWKTADVIESRQAARDTLLLRILRARRLLVRFQLITDETVTAEFRLGPQTHPVITRILSACKNDLPTDTVPSAAQVFVPSSDQVFIESAVEEKPEVLSGPQLQYPELLQQAAIQGRVIVQAIIDTAGRAEPSSIKIIQSPNPGFDQSARDYVLRALFRPARLHGRAVRALMLLPIEFKINRR